MTGSTHLDAGGAWALLRALAERAQRGDPVREPAAIRLERGQVVEVEHQEADVVLSPGRGRGWSLPVKKTELQPEVVFLLDLYMPLCVGSGCRRLVVGHLGQSLDGRIATHCGVSRFITGHGDIEHSHRMRALFDAVLVGASTVEHDDPQLTTRLVPGDNATRVVVDPTRRLGRDYAIFQDDLSPTLLVCAASAAGDDATHGKAKVVTVEDDGGEISTGSILEVLGRLGLGRVFVEGGGVTVSRFLEAGALDRLHVAVAPVILGSGRAGFTLPVIDTLDDALSLECRHFIIGSDVLFDCVVGAPVGR